MLLQECEPLLGGTAVRRKARLEVLDRHAQVVLGAAAVACTLTCKRCGAPAAVAEEREKQLVLAGGWILARRLGFSRELRESGAPRAAGAHVRHEVLPVCEHLAAGAPDLV